MMAISSGVGLTGDSIGMFRFLPDDDGTPLEEGKLDGFAIFGTNGRAPFFPLMLSMFVQISISNGTNSSMDLSMSPLTMEIVHGDGDSTTNRLNLYGS